MRSCISIVIFAASIVHAVAGHSSGAVRIENEGSSATVRWFQERCSVVVDLRNEGKRELLISAVKSSCGCMTAAADRLKVPPGEKFSIRVEIVVGDHDEDFSKNIVLISDDLERPAFSIPINIQVERSVRLSLANIDFVAPTLEVIKLHCVSVIPGLDVEVCEVACESDEFYAETLTNSHVKDELVIKRRRVDKALRPTALYVRARVTDHASGMRIEKTMRLNIGAS